MRHSRFLSSLVCLCLLSCATYDECEFLNFEIANVPDIKTDGVLDIYSVGEKEESLYECKIFDKYICSLHSDTEFMLSLSDMETGELAGQYFKRGRSGNELISSMPISEILRERAGYSAYLFSPVERKLMKWNISSSLETGTTVYSDIVELGSRRKGILPLMAIYEMTGERVIAYNTGQIGEWYETPAYEIYDMTTSELVEKLPLFNKVEIDTDDERYSSRIFLSLKDCIHPDRSKLAFGMYYMPVINIIDLSDNTCKGFRINGRPRFTPNEKICHFVDMTADENHIYALYCGERLKHNEDFPKYLYVFDWNGSIEYKYELPFRVTGLELSNDKLYFLDYFTNTLHYKELSDMVISTHR